MKRTGTAVALLCLACASCVEVTTARKSESVTPAAGGGYAREEKSEVHVYAWNPFDDILDAAAYPFKAAWKGIRKVF